jgi:hypothetical protein
MSWDYDDLDLGPPLRESLMGNPDIALQLEQWSGEPAIFTRRPVPDDAPDLIILINPPASLTDADGLTSDRPIVSLYVAVYGRKGKPGTAEDQSRIVERLGFRIRTHFHRQRFSVQPEGFSVIDVRAGGPVPAPTDDDQTVGRLVSLIVRLRRNR